MNLHYAIQKLTTQQWYLYNFRLPLTIDVILVVTISATVQRESLSTCTSAFAKPELPSSLQLTKIPLAIASATVTSQIPFDLLQI